MMPLLRSNDSAPADSASKPSNRRTGKTTPGIAALIIVNVDGDLFMLIQAMTLAAVIKMFQRELEKRIVAGARLIATAAGECLEPLRLGLQVSPFLCQSCRACGSE